MSHGIFLRKSIFIGVFDIFRITCTYISKSYVNFVLLTFQTYVYSYMEDMSKTLCINTCMQHGGFKVERPGYWGPDALMGDSLELLKLCQKKKLGEIPDFLC